MSIVRNSKAERTRRMMDDLRRIVQALRSSHRAATKAKVTGAQLFVMNTLRAAGRPLSIGEVAERTRTDPSTVSVVVDKLVRRGLVRRSRSDADARRNELTLTPRGTRLERSVPPTVAQESLARALDKLAPAEAEMLSSVLHRICVEMGCVDTEATMFGERPARSQSSRED